MSQEKADTAGVRKDLTDSIDRIEEEVDENWVEGKDRVRKLTSGVREKISSIGESDDDKKLRNNLEKAREHLDEMEAELDDGVDERREKTAELVEDARARLDELEDRVHGG